MGLKARKQANTQLLTDLKADDVEILVALALVRAHSANERVKRGETERKSTWKREQESARQ